MNPNRGGTGLGLAITQQIVQLHNGEMYIDSEIEKGTTVMIELPLTKQQEILQLT